MPASQSTCLCIPTGDLVVLLLRAIGEKTKTSVDFTWAAVVMLVLKYSYQVFDKKVEKRQL